MVAGWCRQKGVLGKGFIAEVRPKKVIYDFHRPWALRIKTCGRCAGVAERREVNRAERQGLLACCGLGFNTNAEEIVLHM